jgi:diguanylate cyclase (GGDEF)-like protein/PAS domain S-box-containing protein
VRFRRLRDPDEITLRSRDVLIGGALGSATAVAVLAYLVQEGPSEHRSLLAALCVAWIVAGGVLFALPRRRIVASRWREPFLLTWSVLVVGSITLAVILDGRSGSPLIAALVLPLLFAAISYPVGGTAIVACLTLAGAGIAATATGQHPADTTFQMLALAIASVMAVWQALGRAQRADALAAEHRRAQHYLDVAGTMIVVLAPDGTIEQINRRSCEVLGRSEDELKGRDWFEVALPEELRESARETFERALAGLPVDPLQNETQVVTAWGERRSVAWKSRAVATSSGTGLLISGEDVTDQRAAQERAEHLAYHDPLTGLANRAKLEDHLARALAAARRHQRSVAVLYIDLDRFKLVNDTLGHAAGDELLCEVARRLLPRVRASDLLARYGGDEFMLLLSDIDGDARAAAQGVAAELLAALETPFEIEGHEFEISASIGVSAFPEDGTELSDVLKRADTALYEAKHDGRATIRFASEPEAAPAGRLTLTARLRRALARDELELHYQPVYHVASGKLATLEALLRWDDPERGMIPPGDFIPIAEDSGLIEPLGDWVVDAVIAQAAAWRELGHAPEIAFNVSPRQLRSPGFGRRLLDRFERAGADPRQFIVEITESAAMADPERTRPLLDALATAGLRLAIDDFGADFSSLARLRDLPVHELKIDRSFLRGVPDDARASAVVQAIVQLADALELTAVAEGVETLDQLLFLAEHRCTLAQGFHLARPLPAEQATRLLGYPLVSPT